MHFFDQQGAEQCLLEAISKGKRKIQIFASLVKPPLFDSAACLESLSCFARSSRSAYMEILIEDQRIFLECYPALLALSQRLTGHIEIRSVPVDIRSGTACFLIGDLSALWLVPNKAYLSGTYQPSAKIQASQYADRFLYFWERSKQPEELRRLSF